MREETIKKHLENYINGNVKDFITVVRKISKKDMLHMIELAECEFGIKRDAIIKTLQNIL